MNNTTCKAIIDGAAAMRAADINPVGDVLRLTAQKGPLSIGIVAVGDEVAVTHYNRGSGDRSHRDFGPDDSPALLAHLTTWATS